MTRNQSRITLVLLFLIATIAAFCAPIFRLPYNASLQFRPGSTGIYSGSGAPTLTAPKGSLYLRNNGGAGTSLYVNESGTGTWTAGTLGGVATVPNGGTGLATLTAHSLQVGAGTSALTQLAVGATGQVLQGSTSADPVWNTRPAFTAGTAIVNTDWAATGGSIGATGAITVGTGSTDTRGSVIITTGGAGEGANPILTLTFKDGTFTSVPFSSVTWAGDKTQTILPISITDAATTLTINIIGTLADSKVYTFDYITLK